MKEKALYIYICAYFSIIILQLNNDQFFLKLALRFNREKKKNHIEKISVEEEI